jgi:hypothetical protein
MEGGWRPLVKVTILRGGGLAGMVTRTEVDADALSAQDAQVLASEVDRSGVRQLKEPASGRRWPDELQYEIALEDGTDEFRLRFTEQTLPEEVRRLVEWIDARPERSHSIDP